jgi:hypothetical protein
MTSFVRSPFFIDTKENLYEVEVTLTEHSEFVEWAKISLRSSLLVFSHGPSYYVELELGNLDLINVIGPGTIYFFTQSVEDAVLMRLTWC